MGRDFAKKGRHKGHSNTAQSGHWVWLLAGVTIGVFISAIAFFKLLPQYTNFAQQAQEPTSKTTVVEEESKRTPHFDFYSLLPELEVKVPETKKETQEKETIVEAPQTSKNGFRLQLASFRDYKDADSFKAQMAFMGIEVEIEAVTLAPNDTWYRVRSLPYSNRDQAESARKQLQAQSIQSLLLEEKG